MQANLNAQGFEIISTLGEGGEGVVYLAKDSQRRLVALKVLYE